MPWLTTKKSTKPRGTSASSTEPTQHAITIADSALRRSVDVMPSLRPVGERRGGASGSSTRATAATAC
jgi:hypothetical protein